MGLYENLLNRTDKLSVIGLGYVGLPIAVAFSKVMNVVGFDVNKEKIADYIDGVDRTCEVGNAALAECSVQFTSDASELRGAKFHIVAVPTPVDTYNKPNLSLVEAATETLAKNIAVGSMVVYESTVYPGVTEDVCVPIIERVSGLKCGKDFFVGYSPERINPGDKIHRLDSVVKIVSGMDDETLDTVAKVYETVVTAGVYRAESIKVAETAKVIENSQRDVNIAFMNELSMICDKMDIDTLAVLNAASTKWNFINFFPGLVGGHCIGVDPYYLTYKAEQLGYSSQVIMSGRRINDGMGKYIAENVIKRLVQSGVVLSKAKVAIFGLTFKENCPDTRNTKVYDIIRELKEYRIDPVVVDPVADKTEAEAQYGIKLCGLEGITDMDAIIIAVAHDRFRTLTYSDINRIFKVSPNTEKVLVDVKGILDKKEYIDKGYKYWRL